MFLIVLVYLSMLSVAASISGKINLDSCWHRDILMVKSQAKSQNVTVLQSILLQSIRTHSMTTILPQQVSMVFLLLLDYQIDVVYIFDEISLSPCWHKDILRVKVKL